MTHAWRCQGRVLRAVEVNARYPHYRWGLVLKSEPSRTHKENCPYAALFRTDMKHNK